MMQFKSSERRFCSTTRGKGTKRVGTLASPIGPNDQESSVQRWRSIRRLTIELSFSRTEMPMEVAGSGLLNVTVRSRIYVAR